MMSNRLRSHHHSRPALSARKFPLFPFKGRSLFYFCVFLAVLLFALASMVLQSSFASAVFRMGGGSERRERLVREGLKFGSPQRQLARGGGVLSTSWIGCGGVGLELVSSFPYFLL
ncbi:hypothetical protein RHMOL_Rhmol01G0192200 [Rhododendron molle]|uniref:Uncharacterized protein n=1 Tax=Rhododendron molle TaxID=49168 RepID=A0ACC0Q4L1_RHOML|nr:hypothetical protein RHMOL_Rhmol01G0192200 [Rhododendron molle]